MDAGEHYHVCAMYFVEDAVWKTPQENPPRLVCHRLIAQRCPSKHGGGCSKCAQELTPEPSLLSFVPVGGFGDVLLRFRPSDKSDRLEGSRERALDPLQSFLQRHGGVWIRLVGFRAARHEL